MAIPTTVLNDKYAIVKMREGERMARYLRILFGREKFGFEWVEEGTSYTDGKNIYSLYTFLKPATTTPFEIPEQRVLRKATSVHERGHIEYDTIQDYIDWQQAWSSGDVSEWQANEKYPMTWLSFFGNVMLDGRMENFVVTEHPTTKEYLEFKNYQWKVPVLEEFEGKDNIHDFRSCFFRMAMGMSGYDGWLEESVALVDTIQPLINKARVADSTTSCLDLTLEMIKSVWPTLLEWMDLEDIDPEEFNYEDEHADSQWGESDEVKQSTDRVIVKLMVSNADEGDQSDGQDGSDDDRSGAAAGSNEEDSEGDQSTTVGDSDNEAGEDERSEDHETSTASEDSGNEDDHPSGPDYSKILKIESKMMEEDEQEAEDASQPYVKREETVTIWQHRENRKAFSENITICPFDRFDLDRYNTTLSEIKRHITPVSNAIRQLLDPVADEVRRNQRSGKLKPNRVWRAESLGEANVFDRRMKGSPEKDARIFLLNDISGSTGATFSDGSHRIIDEMRKAQILLIEACDKAGIPVASYGYTENFHYDTGDDETIIHPFKPYGRFTNVEKSLMGGIEPRGGNRDTLSLQWAVNEVAKYPEEIRVIIVLSDGEPCFSDNEDYDTMRTIVQQAEKKGIDVLCLYVGPQEEWVLEKVRYMYPGKSIVVSNQLSRELSRSVKRIIRKRR